MAHLELLLMGSATITLGERPVIIKSHKARALLYYVALARQPVARETLVALLWPDSAENTARSNLRTQLATLRKTLGNHINIERHAVSLAPSVFVDARTFRHNMTSNRDADTLRDLLRYYRDDFLKGFAVVDSAEYEQWQLAQQEMLRLLAIEGLQRIVNAYADDDTDAALAHARHWVTLAPLQEAAHRAVMRLLAATGQRSEALQQFQHCRRLLAEELDIEPTAETRALAQRIQIGESAGGHGTTPNNLPAPTTPFVGRSAEINQITARLRDDDCRLLTIHGAGGIGKSRLAQQCARTLLYQSAHQFVDGIYFVTLEHVHTHSKLVSTVASSLGCHLDSGKQADKQLLNFLANKACLLILDNVEQFIDICGPWLMTVLQQCGGVTLLLTSRQPLSFYEETQFLLAGLPLAVGNATADSAQQLFAQRANRVDITFALENERGDVDAICERVAGMPLAIEMVAAYAGDFSCADMRIKIEANLAELATRAVNRPPRHQSLRAVFNYSWQMLTQHEQQALAACTTFTGSFAAQAAHSIASIDHDTLKRLAAKSLLQQVGVRFALHPVVREFAQSERANEPTLELAHRSYFLNLLAAKREDIAQGDVQIISRLQADDSNLLAAWQHALSNTDALLPYADVLASYAKLRGWATEARERFVLGRSHLQMAYHAASFAIDLAQYAVAKQETAEILVGLDEQQDCHLYARFTFLAGVIAQHLGDYTEAQALLKNSAELFQSGQDQQRYVNTLAVLYRVYARLGLTEEADAALSIVLKSMTSPRERARALNYYGTTCISRGNFEQAVTALSECRDINLKLGHPDGAASANVNLAIAALRLGDMVKAETSAGDARQRFKRSNSRFGEAVAEYVLAEVARGRRDFDLATAHLEQALAIYQSAGNRFGQARMTHFLGCVSAESGNPNGIALLYQAIRMMADLSIAAAVVTQMADLAACLDLHGQTRIAAQLARFAAGHELTEGYQKQQALDLAQRLGADQYQPITSLEDALALCKDDD